MFSFFPYREESGLNNSQIHIGPTDPSSLFLEAKDQNNGEDRRVRRALDRIVAVSVYSAYVAFQHWHVLGYAS